MDITNNFPPSLKRSAENPLSEAPAAKKQKTVKQTSDASRIRLLGFANRNWGNKIPSYKKGTDDLINFARIAKLAMKHSENPEATFQIKALEVIQKCLTIAYSQEIPEDIREKIMEIAKQTFQRSYTLFLRTSDHQCIISLTHPTPEMLQNHKDLDQKIFRERQIEQTREGYLFLAQYRSNPQGQLEVEISNFFLFHKENKNLIQSGKIPPFFENLKIMLECDQQNRGNIIAKLTEYFVFLTNRHPQKVTFPALKSINPFHIQNQSKEEIDISSIYFLGTSINNFLLENNFNKEELSLLQENLLGIEIVHYELLLNESFNGHEDKMSDSLISACSAYKLFTGNKNDSHLITKKHNIFKSIIFVLEGWIYYIYNQPTDKQEELKNQFIKLCSDTELCFFVDSCGNGLVLDGKGVEILADHTEYFRDFKADRRHEEKTFHSLYFISKKQLGIALKTLYYTKEDSYLKDISFLEIKNYFNSIYSLDTKFDVFNSTEHFPKPTLEQNFIFELLIILKPAFYFRSETLINRILEILMQIIEHAHEKRDRTDFDLCVQIKSLILDHLEFPKQTAWAMKLQHAIGCLFGGFLNNLSEEEIENVSDYFKKQEIIEIDIFRITNKMIETKLFESINVLNLNNGITKNSLMNLLKMDIPNLEHLIILGGIDKETKKQNILQGNQLIDLLNKFLKKFPKLLSKNITAYGHSHSEIMNWRTDAEAKLLRGLYQPGFSPEERFELFKEAADEKLPEAQLVMGKCYELGKPVPQDINEALSCFKLAANQGCFEAILSILEFDQKDTEVNHLISQEELEYYKNLSHMEFPQNKPEMAQTLIFSSSLELEDNPENPYFDIVG